MNQDTRPAEGAFYVFGSFTLDPRFRRLLQQDAIVPLTSKAFDTLEVLVRSAGLYRQQGSTAEAGVA